MLHKNDVRHVLYNQYSSAYITETFDVAHMTTLIRFLPPSHQTLQLQLLQIHNLSYLLPQQDSIFVASSPSLAFIS